MQALYWCLLISKAIQTMYLYLTGELQSTWTVLSGDCCVTLLNHFSLSPSMGCCSSTVWRFNGRFSDMRHPWQAGWLPTNKCRVKQDVQRVTFFPTRHCCAHTQMQMVMLKTNKSNVLPGCVRSRPMFRQYLKASCAWLSLPSARKPMKHSHNWKHLQFRTPGRLKQMPDQTPFEMVSFQILFATRSVFVWQTTSWLHYHC